MPYSTGHSREKNVNGAAESMSATRASPLGSNLNPTFGCQSDRSSAARDGQRNDRRKSKEQRLRHRPSRSRPPLSLCPPYAIGVSGNAQRCPAGCRCWAEGPASHDFTIREQGETLQGALSIRRQHGIVDDDSSQLHDNECRAEGIDNTSRAGS